MEAQAADPWSDIQMKFSKAPVGLQRLTGVLLRIITHESQNVFRFNMRACGQGQQSSVKRGIIWIFQFASSF